MKRQGVVHSTDKALHADIWPHRRRRCRLLLSQLHSHTTPVSRCQQSQTAATEFNISNNRALQQLLRTLLQSSSHLATVARVCAAQHSTPAHMPELDIVLCAAQRVNSLCDACRGSASAGG